MSLRFRLLTPERTLFDEEALSVSLPTVEGEITVLPHHAPLAALLVPGIIRIKKTNGEDEVAVSGGFIQIQEDGQTVIALAETAERGHELDLSIIEDARRRAIDVMKQAARQDDVSFAAAAAALERELARYRVATKHKSSTRGLQTNEP